MDQIKNTPLTTPELRLTISRTESKFVVNFHVFTFMKPMGLFMALHKHRLCAAVIS